MILYHWMRNVADFNCYDIAFYLNYRNVLFCSSVFCVRIQFHHFLSAAYWSASCCLNFSYYLTAFQALIKLEHILPPSLK